MNSAIKECAKAAKLLELARQGQYEPIPSGWFTLEQFMEHEQCGQTLAWSGMKKLTRDGKVVSQRWPARATDGKTYYVTIYKTK